MSSSTDRMRAMRNRPEGYLKSRASRWRYLGIINGTPEVFFSLLERQGNLCPICGLEVGLRDCLDHDHETGLARGVLHRQCNTLVGAYESRGSASALFQALEAYVSSSKQKE